MINNPPPTEALPSTGLSLSFLRRRPALPRDPVRPQARSGAASLRNDCLSVSAQFLNLPLLLEDGRLTRDSQGEERPHPPFILSTGSPIRNYIGNRSQNVHCHGQPLQNEAFLKLHASLSSTE